MTIKHNLHFLLLALLLLPTTLQAQELSVKSFTESPNDLTARIENRTDNNGVPCAVVKVLLAAEGAQFDGMVVGEPKTKTGEYAVFMANGAKKLTVRLKGYLPLTIKFDDYGIPALVSKSTYQMVVTGLISTTQDTITLKDTVYLKADPVIESSKKEITNFIMATVMPTHTLSEGLKQLAYGITFGQMKTFGWYVNLTSNFVFKKSSGDIISSDGITSDGDLILITGERTTSLFQLTAGATYRLSDHFRILAGAGFGIRNVLLQDESGMYYKSNGGGGVSLELGACYTLGPVSLEADLCTPAFSGITLKLGLGMNF